MRVRYEDDVAAWWDLQPREELRLVIAWFQAKSPEEQARLLADRNPATQMPATRSELSSVSRT
jgi:hypothetical protein